MKKKKNNSHKQLRKADVAVIMGSKTDWKIMKAATEALNELGISHNVQIISAHRTPEFMQKFSLSAATMGYKVIIAGAGGAAHLPGMVASLTTLPVIGVPVCVGKLAGLDALLSVVQMPSGVPVATVAVDNAYNAGLLAGRILATFDRKIADRLADRRTTAARKVLATRL